MTRLHLTQLNEIADALNATGSEELTGLAVTLTRIIAVEQAAFDKKVSRRAARREKKKADRPSAEERRVAKGTRCTYVTLKALGIEGRCPTDHAGMLAVLAESGKKVEAVKLPEGCSLATFIALHGGKKGSYYLSSAKHAMALVDGKLTDTAGLKDHNKVVLRAAHKVA